MVSLVLPRIKAEWQILLGSLLVIGALYNHYLGHSVYLIEIILVAAGIILALLAARRMGRSQTEPELGVLVRLMSRFLPRERCGLVLSLIGFAIIVAWTARKLYILDDSKLAMEDFMVTLLGLSLVLYTSAPSKYSIPKDFVVLYLMFVTIVFVVIWKAYSLITGESYYEVTAYSEYYFITIPVVSLLKLFGVHAEALLNLSGYGLSNIIDYDHDGRMLRVAIGTGCSGLYSAGLFFSAFLSFVLVRYNKVDRYILGALGLGLLVTWFSNILRMTITIMAGAAWGHPALALVHSYIGIVLFVLFAAIFWVLIVKWLDRKEDTTTVAEKQVQDMAQAP